MRIRWLCGIMCNMIRDRGCVINNRIEIMNEIIRVRMNSNITEMGEILLNNSSGLGNVLWSKISKEDFPMYVIICLLE